MKTSIVIPVFNEEQTLPELLRRTLAVCDVIGPAEIILVNDGSRDRSAAILAAAAEAYPGQVVALDLNRNYGQHAAVMAGLAEAQGDVVVTLDADLQNPPEEIPRLVAKIREGYDVVGTIRAERRDHALRRLASWLTNRITARSTGVTMSDFGCMLRAYRRPVVDAMLQCREQSTFIPVLANAFARETTEIEVSHAARAAGSSKYSVWKLIHLQIDLVTSMTHFPLRVLSLVGALMSLVGIGFGSLLLVLRLIHGAVWAANGTFTLFAVLFFLVGAQFMAMGVLGEYVGRIYDDVRARPRYFVDRRSGRSDLTKIETIEARRERSQALGGRS
jgi:undecaprenyl-phosphate 4-deoxy-4-formamido-L-arabinose transferase